MTIENPKFLLLSDKEKEAILGEGMMLAYVGYGDEYRFIERVRLLPCGFNVYCPSDGCIYRKNQWERV